MVKPFNSQGNLSRYTSVLTISGGVAADRSPIIVIIVDINNAIFAFFLLFATSVVITLAEVDEGDWEEEGEEEEGDEEGKGE